MLPVINHAIDWVEKNDGYKPSIIVLLQPTSPLRTSRHIDEAIKILREHPQSDSLVSITEVPHSCGLSLLWKLAMVLGSLQRLGPES